jgi:dipeptide/tripeptide permease
MEMNRMDRFESGQIITAGEKALIVMLVAGLFGFWAGFNLSSQGAPAGLPAATASSFQVATQPVPEAPAPQPSASVRKGATKDTPNPAR